MLTGSEKGETMNRHLLSMCRSVLLLGSLLAVPSRHGQERRSGIGV
jgi:hypothetical protein